MIDSINTLTIGSFVYNNKVNKIAKIVAIDNGVKTEWQIDNSDLKCIDEIFHYDIDLIPISIENIYAILGLNLTLDEDTSNEYGHKDYYDFFNQIRLSVDSMFEGDIWYIHVDNEDYDSIGAAQIKYINDIQTFFKLIGFDLDSYINKETIEIAKAVLKI